MFITVDTIHSNAEFGGVAECVVCRYDHASLRRLTAPALPGLPGKSWCARLCDKCAADGDAILSSWHERDEEDEAMARPERWRALEWHAEASAALRRGLPMPSPETFGRPVLNERGVVFEIY